MRQISRRSFVLGVAASGVAIGLSTLTRPTASGIAWAQARQDEAVHVRVGKIVQAGLDFRNGLAEGVRLPGTGGDAWGLTATRAAGQYTSEPLQTNFPCSHVGVHWQAEDHPARRQTLDGARGEEGSGLRVEVRTSRDGQRWSAWRRVPVEAHVRDGGALLKTAPTETFGALVGGRLGTWLQYRLTFADGGPAMPVVRQVALTYLDSRGPSPESRAASQTGLGSSSGGLKAGKAAFLARLITREEWGADESIRFVDGREEWPRAFVAPKLLVVHHTATDNEYADPAAEVRAIYTYHTVTQGFGDIGYHLLIDDRGQAYEGRRGRETAADGQPGRELLSPDVVAGHAYGYNYGSVGIAVLGNFTEGEPGESALHTLEEALAFEAASHGIDPTARVAFLRARARSGEDQLWRDELAAVCGHRDCVPTECPGERLYERLPQIRDRVAARIGPAGPRAQITQAPEDRDIWPTDLVFSWEGSEAAAQFSTRLEGWRLSTEPDRIVPLSGYGPEERPRWSPWSLERAASFALPPDAHGSYTFHVRARAAGGREGVYAARWPLFVDRHVLADNRDARRAARQGDWRRTGDILGYNGADYEQAEPAGTPASFTWTLDVPESGTYRVLASWTEGEFRASNAGFTISVNGQRLAEAEVSQRERGGVWVQLARVPLPAGATCRVDLGNAADGVVVADAVRIVLDA